MLLYAKWVFLWPYMVPPFLLGFLGAYKTTLHTTHKYRLFKIKLHAKIYYIYNNL